MRPAGLSLTLLLLLAATAAGAYTPGATPVADGIYAIVGPTTGRTYDNHALNNNLGFVVTPEGVILVDSGASARLERYDDWHRTNVNRTYLQLEGAR